MPFSRALLPLLLAGLALTAGCQSLPGPAQTGHLPKVSGFSLSGKIGFRTEEDSGSANLRWTQSGDTFEIYLSGPLGAGGARLFGHPGFAQLQTSDEKTFSASSPEALMQDVLGWHLPVSALRHWVRARQAPGESGQARRDEAGRLVSISAPSWDISLDRWREDGSPGRLKLRHTGLTVTLLIGEFSCLNARPC